ncbi:replication initiation protein [Rothia aerolata]|uniref:replication initiation protein n=1 Tax=Rothia aerolata TaxID=1812262 RepID=UPI0035A21C05
MGAQVHDKSAQMKLLAATTCVLGEFLDHDPHFPYRFSRNPFSMGKAPTAYRWYKIAVLICTGFSPHLPPTPHRKE